MWAGEGGCHTDCQQRVSCGFCELGTGAAAAEPRLCPASRRGIAGGLDLQEVFAQGHACMHAKAQSETHLRAGGGRLRGMHACMPKHSRRRTSVQAVQD